MSTIFVMILQVTTKCKIAIEKSASSTIELTTGMINNRNLPSSPALCMQNIITTGPPRQQKHKNATAKNGQKSPKIINYTLNQ